MNTKYLVPIIFLVSLYLIISAFHSTGFLKINIPTPNPVYLAFSGLIFGSIFLIIQKLGASNKIKQIIARETLKNNIHIINIGGVEYYYIGFRIIGKENVEDEKVDYEKEMKAVVESVSKNKSRKIKVATVTILDPSPGTSIIFFSKRNEMTLSRFHNEALYLKHTIESMAPHLTLEEVNLKTNPMLPLPQLLGTVVYPGYIMQKKIEVVSSSEEQIVVGDFDVELGVVPGSDNRTIGIRSSDVFRHIAIFGATGGGKTNTSALLVRELQKKGFDVVVLDWHGEYHNYLPNFNHYEGDNLPVLNPLGSKEARALNVADMIGDILELTEPQRFALQKAIDKYLKDNNDVDFKDLPQIIDEHAEELEIQQNVAIALIRNLEYLFSGIGEKLISKNGLSYKELAEKLKGGNIINLRSMGSDIRIRKLYGLLIAKFLIEYFMEYKPKDRKLYLVLEEAQNYLRERNMIIERALQEVRKFGVGICIVTQSPTTIDSEVLKNTNIKIVHAIKTNDDKRVVADSMGLSAGRAKILDKLDVGEALVTAPNIKKEVIVKIKKVT